jgi:UDP-N-acetylglucosamine 1-carboxyvinyltransferase
MPAGQMRSRCTQLALLVAALSVADGAAIATENIFGGRFRYVDELCRMGADIRVEYHYAVIRGVPRLSGAQVRAHAIRAGAAIVMAALGADGETVIFDAHHVARGYDRFIEKLRSIGAEIDAD